jgi:hypothetical protein
MLNENGPQGIDVECEKQAVSDTCAGTCPGPFLRSLSRLVGFLVAKDDVASHAQ